VALVSFTVCIKHLTEVSGKNRGCKFIVYTIVVGTVLTIGLFESVLIYEICVINNRNRKTMKSKRKLLSRLNPFKPKNPLDLAISVFVGGLLVGILIMNYGNVREIDPIWWQIPVWFSFFFILVGGIYGVFRIHYLLKDQPKDQGFWYRRSRQNSISVRNTSLRSQDTAC